MLREKRRFCEQLCREATLVQGGGELRTLQVLLAAVWLRATLKNFSHAFLVFVLFSLAVRIKY